MRKIQVPIMYLAMTLSPLALADICPPPPASIDPSVTTNVTYSKKTGYYTYSYTLANSPAAAISISDFSILSPIAPVNAKSPKNWNGSFVNIQSQPFRFTWQSMLSPAEVKQYSATPNAVITDTKSSIHPGAHLAGFSFESLQLPGIQQYFAAGETQVPSGTPTAADDEPVPNCPGWDFESAPLQSFVTGLASGPSAPNTVSVRLRLPDEKGVHAFGPINPNMLAGKIAVLVMSTKTLDAGQISVPSIKFGPGKASPLLSMLFPAGKENLRPIDEREEWERLRDAIEDDRQIKNPQLNLLLVFDQKALEIQCGLDKALFLTGSTLAGQNIIGAVSTQLTGCDTKKPGNRPHHKGK